MEKILKNHISDKGLYPQYTNNKNTKGYLK